jgi:hypothetical protein
MFQGSAGFPGNRRGKLRPFDRDLGVIVCFRCFPATMLSTGGTTAFQPSVEKVCCGFNVSTRSLDGMMGPPVRASHLRSSSIKKGESTEAVFSRHILN